MFYGTLNLGPLFYIFKISIQFCFVLNNFDIYRNLLSVLEH
jgi:hypothetical protein